LIAGRLSAKSCLSKVFSLCLLKRLTAALEAALLPLPGARKQSATEHCGSGCYLYCLLASALITFVPNSDRRFKKTNQINTEFHTVMLHVRFTEYGPAEDVIKLTYRPPFCFDGCALHSKP
jgi:hypothetical protein